jgi:hypothetical protein
MSKGVLNIEGFPGIDFTVKKGGLVQLILGKKTSPVGCNERQFDY